MSVMRRCCFFVCWMLPDYRRPNAPHRVPHRNAIRNTWRNVCYVNICPLWCFFSFVSAEISPMVQLRVLCFTSDATLFGSAVDVRARE
jgi:hypothetical protein